MSQRESGPEVGVPQPIGTQADRFAEQHAPVYDEHVVPAALRAPLAAIATSRHKVRGKIVDYLSCLRALPETPLLLKI